VSHHPLVRGRQLRHGVYVFIKSFKPQTQTNRQDLNGLFYSDLVCVALFDMFIEVVRRLEWRVALCFVFENMTTDMCTAYHVRHRMGVEGRLFVSVVGVHLGFLVSMVACDVFIEVVNRSEWRVA
jgi:hypothetical protein